MADLFAQDECEMFFPAKEGTIIEVKSYDHKDKLTGSTVQKILSVTEEGSNKTVEVAHESFDKKGEKLMDGEFAVRCEAGIFYLDMRNMLDAAALSAYENMDIEVDAVDMAFPADLKVGTDLPDANITVGISSGGMTMFSMTVLVTNRKIEAKENITTPAGTFECYKMSYDVETKMVMKILAKAIQWFAEGIGVVRTENYNKKDKLQGYSVLTSLK